ncbi:MAG: glycosyltransferase family 4 protein [Candidatus Saccharibacteria bacterium]|nr:glycosyltransferase family 4 protein [Candidatus Saccharibacteria bacterium]
MRIGVDVRTMEGGAQHRGIGRFATSLIEAMSKIDTRNDYYFFVSHKNAQPPDFQLAKGFKQSAQHGGKQGLRGIKYVRIIYAMPKKLAVDTYDLDVFFQLDPFMPITAHTTPVVTMLYDLIPFLFPKTYQHVPLNGYTPGHFIGYTRSKIKWKILTRMVATFAQADRVISISEHSKKDLISLVPIVNPKKVVAIPLAGELPASKNPGPGALKIVQHRSFLFYFGGADPRKGLVAFTKTLDALWESHPEVYVVYAGKEILDMRIPEARRLDKATSQVSRPKQVIRLGYISDDELMWALKNARSLVFPSSYEGFGLPVLQAMQAGCPVVAYNNSSIPEVAGKAAVLVKDGTSMVPALQQILSDKTYRSRLVREGRLQASKFTWEKSARQTLKVLTEAAKEKKA